MLGVVMGSFCQIFILIRYVQTRFKLIYFGQAQAGDELLEVPVISNSVSYGAASSNGGRSQRRRDVFDRWLIIRFTIAFKLLMYACAALQSCFKR